jgi:hypothetical protein
LAFVTKQKEVDAIAKTATRDKKRVMTKQGKKKVANK